MLGSFGRPNPPPLLRRHHPVHDDTDGVSWSQARSMLSFNDTTGAMNATPDELVGLHAKVRRAFGAR